MGRAYRAYSALTFGLAVAACGLSVRGLAQDDVETEAGVDAATLDVAVSPVDAGPPPPPPDCHVAYACDGGGAGGFCRLESCSEKPGAIHFEEYNANGGDVKFASGHCSATTPTKDGLSVLRSEIPNAPLHYAYRVNAEFTGDDVFALVVYASTDGPVRPRGGGYFVMADGGTTFCRSTPGLTDAGADCRPLTLPRTPGGGVYLRFSGEVDRRDGGKATMVLEAEDSPLSCAEVVRVDVAGPYEDRATLLIGCAGGPCDAKWNELRFEIEELR